MTARKAGKAREASARKTRSEGEKGTVTRIRREAKGTLKEKRGKWAGESRSKREEVMDFIRPLGGRPSVFSFASPLPSLPPPLILRSTFPRAVRPPRYPSRPLLNCLPLIFTPVPLRYGPSAGQALRDICGAARVGRIKSREGRGKKNGKKRKSSCVRANAPNASLPSTIS